MAVLIGLCCVFAMSSGEGSAKTIEDVQLSPATLAPECSPTEGEHPVSMQARTHYTMVESYPQGLFKAPGRKAYQSFACSEAKSTIYYYEYANKDDLDTALGFTKGVIWGEGGRSSIHPEYIFPVDNVLVIISSRKPEHFANAFFYGVPGEAGEMFGKARESYRKHDYAKAEKQFRALTRSAPTLPLGQLYVGHSLFYQTKYREAITAYERAREVAVKYGGLDQQNRRIMTDQLGMAYALDGRFEDAKTHFESASQEDPEYPMSYYNLACTFAELGNLDGAVANLKKEYAHKDQMLPGEIYPDPRTDDSFRRYLDNEKFKAAMKELGY